MPPEGWRELLWTLAYFYHFSAEELMDMTLDDILFWGEGVKQITERMNADGR